MPTWVYPFLVFWFFAVAIPVGYLMGFHMTALAPLDLAQIEPLFKHPSDQRWHMDHILGGDCECSLRVAEYLSKRKPLKFFLEKIYLVGKNIKLLENLRLARFEVEELDAEVASQKYHLSAFPVLFIYRPNGSLAYTGGYSMNRFARNESDFEDIQIIQAVMSGQISTPRPIFGCANGLKLRNQMDPLHLKYKKSIKYENN